MAVITIRGQLGSGAPQIGKQVAEKLHIEYVDREIIALVARKLKSSRREILEKEMPPGSLLGRIVEVMGSTYPFNPLYPDISMPVGEIPLNDANYLEGLTHVITKIASNQPIVIMGRGSQFILRDVPEALHILFIAPLDLRIKRVMQELKMDEESSKKEIENYDGSRRAFIKRYFKADLEDPKYYDMIINTERLDFNSSVSVICHAVSLRN
jgi:cytidylate kinase